MRYLLDTNIVSELRKKKPSEDVISWIKKIHPNQLYISCITLGEIRTGALKKYKQDKLVGKELLIWVDKLIKEYFEQILIIDQETCEEWANLLLIDNTNAVDGLIAAQAIQMNMTLVTRNLKHFQMFPVKLFNPFEEVRE